jgi:hypothetical protein
MSEERKRRAQDTGITKTDYEGALWMAHMERLRANIAYCREPGEEIPDPSEYLEPCESGDSFDEEMKKLIAAADRAFHDASLRVQKRVEAWNKLQKETERQARKTALTAPEGWDSNGQGLLFKQKPD